MVNQSQITALTALLGGCGTELRMDQHKKKKKLHLYVINSYNRQPRAHKSLVKVYFLFCQSSGGM